MTAVATLEQTLAKALEQIEALTRENRILREELAIVKRGLFGRSSERLAPGQLGFFGDEALPEPPADGSPAASPKRERRAETKGHGRAPFPPHLVRDTVELDVPEAERACPDCGAAMQPMGEDVTERGHRIPAQFVVRRYVRKKYGCPQGHAVRTAPAPPGVIDGSKYEASVYAHVATAKYCDHLPLNRLEGIFARQSLHLPKQTMWDMLVRVDELVAQPVLAQMRAELLAEPVLHSDESPVTMRLEEGRGSRQTYAWGWRSLRESGISKVLIEFRQSRGRDGPLGFLGNWQGTLILDGYAGFDAVVEKNGIVRAGCWAHARRKLVEAFEVGAKSAAPLLARVQRLFWIERAIARRADRLGLDLDRRRELRGGVRARRSAPLLARVFADAQALELDRSTLPKSKLGKALNYLLAQRKPLSAFLADARLPIHNNDAERDLRHVVVGSKNWMIFASPKGGELACRLYSLVLSCKQSGVDPEAYLEDLLAKIDTTPASQIATLTPWAWAEARRQATGDGA